MADPVTPLQATNLSRGHPNGQSSLLDNVNLSIEAGARIALTGPSGSGKTLLLRALARLDPIDRGSISYHGFLPPHCALPWIRSQVIYLHQRAALIEETIEAALRRPYGLKVHRDRAFDRDRAIRLLASLGRDSEFLNKKVAELSGGEIQITSLVRALLLDPQIFLLDEPTAALDLTATAAVEQLIAAWLDENPQRAMVWVSHNEAQAERVGRRSIRMEAGRLIA